MELSEPKTLKMEDVKHDFHNSSDPGSSLEIAAIEQDLWENFPQHYSILKEYKSKIPPESYRTFLRYHQDATEPGTLFLEQHQDEYNNAMADECKMEVLARASDKKYSEVNLEKYLNTCRMLKELTYFNGFINTFDPMHIDAIKNSTSNDEEVIAAFAKIHSLIPFGFEDVREWHREIPEILTIPVVDYLLTIVPSKETGQELLHPPPPSGEGEMSKLFEISFENGQFNSNYTVTNMIPFSDGTYSVTIGPEDEGEDNPEKD